MSICDDCITYSLTHWNYAFLLCQGVLMPVPVVPLMQYNEQKEVITWLITKRMFDWLSCKANKSVLSIYLSIYLIIPSDRDDFLSEKCILSFGLLSRLTQGRNKELLFSSQLEDPLLLTIKKQDPNESKLHRWRVRARKTWECSKMAFRFGHMVTIKWLILGSKQVWSWSGASLNFIALRNVWGAETTTSLTSETHVSDHDEED